MSLSGQKANGIAEGGGFGKNRKGDGLSNCLMRGNVRNVIPFLFLPACVLVVLAVSYWFVTDDDPMVRSRRLSSWFEEVLSSDREAGGAAAEAIAQLGTNAYPYLIRALESEDGKLRRWITVRTGFIGGYVPASMRQLRACAVLKVMGREAQVLGPYVTNLFASPMPSIRQGAFEAADAMELTGIDVELERALASDSSIRIRLLAAKQLIRGGSEPAMVVDTVVTNLWNRRASRSTLREVANALKQMPIPSVVFEEKFPAYATNQFQQVRDFVSIAAPICLTPSGATNVLRLLPANTRAER
jgi:hypothetical protein